MATNLAIDDNLIEKAKKIGQHKTKKEAVTAALNEYIRRKQQVKILDFFGKVDWDFDYKNARRKK